MSDFQFYTALGSSLFSYFLFVCIYWYVKKFPPKGIGPYGYKTPRSMKNESNWKYANAYSNKLMYQLSHGYIILLLSVLVIFRQVMSNSLFGLLFTGSTVLMVVLLIGITEYKLKQFEKKQV